jgi:hypothetical protein
MTNKYFLMILGFSVLSIVVDHNSILYSSTEITVIQENSDYVKLQAIQQFWVDFVKQVGIAGTVTVGVSLLGNMLATGQLDARIAQILGIVVFFGSWRLIRDSVSFENENGWAIIGGAVLGALIESRIRQRIVGLSNF